MGLAELEERIRQRVGRSDSPAEHHQISVPEWLDEEQRVARSLYPSREREASLEASARPLRDETSLIPFLGRRRTESAHHVDVDCD
jgi:hypothetical protein